MTSAGKMMQSRRAALTALGLATAVLLAAPAAAAPDLTDQAIADAVEDELLIDRAVPSNEIDTSVAHGVVTLKGTVGNLLAKERATRIAETVKGVRSVVNLIEVDPPTTRSDAAVRQDVEAALLSDPAVDSYEVDASVDDGMVTLTGTVQSWKEKQLAGKVAKGVRGVTGLNNEVEIRYEAERTDGEIRTEIEQTLRWDTLVDHALIDVKVDDGKVTLSGTVGSAAEKRRARYDAWVTGVEQVEADSLNVRRWARDEDLRKKKYVTKSDAEIAQAVRDALLYDPRVMSFNVTPEVSGSMVTLRGTVDNMKAKRAAEQVARNTVGVFYVTNRIKVRPADELTDAEIRRNVEQAILRDPYVEDYEIDVKVTNGVARLSGTVDSYFEKYQADDVAATVNGVIAVSNNLDVEYAGPLAYDPYLYDDYIYDYDWYDYEPYYTFETDTEIKEEIRDELWWSPFVDADQVNVTVDDGVATLTGTVNSWDERGTATENAYEGGAVWVDNDLNVQTK